MEACIRLPLAVPLGGGGSMTIVRRVDHNFMRQPTPIFHSIGNVCNLPKFQIGQAGVCIGNTTTGDYATVGGGSGNRATNSYATVPGGLQNKAGGQFSFAAGFEAVATNVGAFVWSDGTGTTTTSFANNQFVVRASGGVVFLTSTAASPTAYSAGTAGASLLPNATSWSRNAKKNFHSVDTEAVLDKLAGIPIQQPGLVT